ncbi:ATP-binding cassette domain-containing protein [Vibrio variabilis]|uniref:ATP-binding cassette domain-containing protein n=1 Tax=Vibrio variabilis TaxID=990271 RepID=UPI0023B7E9F2|nr:ATP-binding cassette domain-containing protein [Vibrio variabilis]
MKLLELNNASLGYEGNTVMQGVNLTIDKGEKIALVGTSGVGKSTLLHELYLHLREQTALCPQDHGLVEPLSVYNNIYMGRLEQFGTFSNLFNLIKPISKRWNEVKAIANVLNLTDKMTISVDKLSGDNDNE